MSRLSERKDALYRQVAPKWGDEAAEYRLKLWKLQLFGIPLAFLVLLGIVVRDNAPVALAIFGILLLGGTLIAIAALVCVRGMNRSASRLLGVKISGWHAGQFPPDTSPAYEEWCAQHGLIPYAASERFRGSSGMSGDRSASPTD